MDNYDYLIKLIIIGDINVGKSSLVSMYCEKYFDDNSACTMGVDFQTSIVQVGNKRVKTHIWDTAGQERFRSITMSYYRDAQAILLIFDLTNTETFNNLAKWMANVNTHVTIDNYKLILVGNKSDLEPAVKKESIQKFVAENNLTYIETSAKKNVNVDNLFVRIVELVLESGAVKDNNGKYISLTENTDSNCC